MLKSYRKLGNKTLKIHIQEKIILERYGIYCRKTSYITKMSVHVLKINKQILATKKLKLLP